MSNARKLLEGMRQNPKNWRIEQLEIVVKRFGVIVRRTSGSHVIFEHPKWTELLCIPAHRPIKAIYVKKLLKLLDTLGWYEQ
jgi:predicted RNA binding protein YcfA (HicA-like mRNA interferase family)